MTTAAAKLQQQEQQSEQRIVRENLKIRVLKLRAKFPYAKITQMQIAQATRTNQSTVSEAFNNPKRVPKQAKIIEQYLDMLERTLDKQHAEKLLKHKEQLCS